jgi:hypothetical protein
MMNFAGRGADERVDGTRNRITSSGTHAQTPYSYQTTFSGVSEDIGLHHN